MPSNDFILPISFRTAQEIGLEESVLIAFLEQHAFMLSSRVLNFEMSVLAAQLPFWTGPMLQRIFSSLQANQMLSFQKENGRLIVHLNDQNQANDIDNQISTPSYQASTAVPSSSESHQVNDELVDRIGRLQRQAKNQPSANPEPSQLKSRKNLASSHMQYANKQAQNQYPTPSESKPRAATNSWPGAHKSQEEKRRGVSDFDLYLEQKERTRQPDQWQPEESTLEQISQAGINRQFALQLLAEFLLRIKEQRKNVRTWNSEFFKYVKRQWQYKQSDRSSHEGTQGSSYSNRTSKEQVSDALTNIHDTDW